MLIFIGLIFLIPLYLIESSNSNFIPDNSTDYLIIIYVAIFASIVSFFSWNMGVSIIGANRAGLFLHLIPIFSSIWAISFLGEQFALFHLIGTIFILMGIILSNLNFIYVKDN